MSLWSEDPWNETFDVVVVGSGAGAMVAALAVHECGGSVLLIERGPVFGGSSAMSGGGLWIPNNHLMASVGISDSPEEALEYLRATTQGTVPEERLIAYVEQAPRMAKFLCERTRVELVPLPEYPDYYPDLPGAKPGGRSLECAPFDGRLLGDELLLMRECAQQELIGGRICMTIKEARDLFCKGPGWVRLTAKLMAGYWLDLPWRLRSSRDRRLAMGNALVGRLRRSLMDRGIPLWLSTRAHHLVYKRGRVVGVAAEREGGMVRLRTERGVILAAGGFESNQSMRRRYLPNPTDARWTCANPYNTGDAIEMGLNVGAALDLMDEAWWGPTTVVPGELRARMLVIEKSLPGSILVNKRGERFVNEAMPYVDVVKRMYEVHSPESPCVPAYLIFDATFRRKYPCGPMAIPGAQQPDWALPRTIRQEYLKKADTLEGLAELMGIDPAGLRATVTKFNEYARTGKDLDFGRGESIFDRYYGDPNVRPNPTLAPIEKPPFYAIEAFPGDLGTKGGLRTDQWARVLNEQGQPIPGLYAAGNCSASVMGRTYPGPGATLGPATTFGYVAGRHAMGVTD